MPKEVWIFGFVSLLMDISSEMIHFRGTAFGFFNLISGVGMLISSALAGLLWDEFGAAFTFWTGAGFYGLCLLGLFSLQGIDFKENS